MADASALPSVGTVQPAHADARARFQAIAAASAAALLGLVLLWGVGFSHIEAVHNAAHDARHSAGFPCH